MSEHTIDSATYSKPRAPELSPACKASKKAKPLKKASRSHGLRFRLYRSGGEHSAAPQQSLRAQVLPMSYIRSVTHVSGPDKIVRLLRLDFEPTTLR
jgi:hypothetical protein